MASTNTQLPTAGTKTIWHQVAGVDCLKGFIIRMISHRWDHSQHKPRKQVNHAPCWKQGELTEQTSKILTMRTVYNFVWRQCDIRVWLLVVVDGWSESLYSICRWTARWSKVMEFVACGLFIIGCCWVCLRCASSPLFWIWLSSSTFYFYQHYYV